jgi:hypothetical protein
MGGAEREVMMLSLDEKATGLLWLARVYPRIAMELVSNARVLGAPDAQDAAHGGELP